MYNHLFLLNQTGKETRIIVGLEQPTSELQKNISNQVTKDEQLLAHAIRRYVLIMLTTYHMGVERMMLSHTDPMQKFLQAPPLALF